MPSPSPRLPPVTTMVRRSAARLSMERLAAPCVGLSSMLTHHLSGSGDVERRDEPNGGRHLVLRQAVAADLHDLAFELGAAIVAVAGLGTQHHVGDDDRA